jgi:CheY-like chemotaxis protein
MQPAAILYVEDEASDVFFLKHALNRAGIEHRLVIAPDGQHAVDYLAGAGAFADRELHPLPCLILLDINLPKKSGLEVLGWIRGQAAFKSLPVLMLTSSSNPKDMEKARLLAADDYLVKPGDPLQLIELVNSFRDRWLSPQASLLNGSAGKEASAQPEA